MRQTGVLFVYATYNVHTPRLSLCHVSTTCPAAVRVVLRMPQMGHL